MSDISLAFEADQLSIDNEWIPGYDISEDMLKKWAAMQQKAHEGFKKILESINPQQ